MESMLLEVGRQTVTLSVSAATPISKPYHSDLHSSQPRQPPCAHDQVPTLSSGGMHVLQVCYTLLLRTCIQSAS